MSPEYHHPARIGPDITPRVAMGGKGCSSKANRAAARARGIAQVIPHKANEKDKPAFFARLLYKGRSPPGHHSGCRRAPGCGRGANGCGWPARGGAGGRGSRRPSAVAPGAVLL